MSEELDIEWTGKTLIVRFTRPEVRNPLSVTVLHQLNEIVDDCRQSYDIKTLIFTGAGQAFASGADLREIAALKPAGVEEFALRGQNLMTNIASLPQTTVAAINGYCMGGALDLALACDHRIASLKAQFAHPGTGLGIITGWGGTQRLPRLVGRARALEMFFTATPIDARRALEIGLVDGLADDPVNAALEKHS